MEVAAQVSELDQLGQLVPSAPPPARRRPHATRAEYELVPEVVVQLLLRRCREHVTALGVLNAVFGDGEAALDRLLT